MAKNGISNTPNTSDEWATRCVNEASKGMTYLPPEGTSLLLTLLSGLFTEGRVPAKKLTEFAEILLQAADPTPKPTECQHRVKLPTSTG